MREHKDFHPGGPRFLRTAKPSHFHTQRRIQISSGIMLFQRVQASARVCECASERMCKRTSARVYEYTSILV